MLSDIMFGGTKYFDNNNNNAPDDDVFYDGDETLALAEVRCMETGTLAPLLKKELKYKILAKCHQEGKELKTDPVRSPPPVKKKLEPDEQKKLEKRREQNRRAAKKFRERKRSETDRLEQATSELETQNKELKDEVGRLRSELNQLITILKTHNCVANIFAPMFDEPGLLDTS